MEKPRQNLLSRKALMYAMSHCCPAVPITSTSRRQRGSSSAHGHGVRLSDCTPCPTRFVSRLSNLYGEDQRSTLLILRTPLSVCHANRVPHRRGTRREAVIHPTGFIARKRSVQSVSRTKSNRFFAEALDSAHFHPKGPSAHPRPDAPSGWLRRDFLRWV
jgi:hypothetical protein